jgi:hypothetical protein
MKKTMLPIAVAIMLLYVGAFFVNSDEQVDPVQKKRVAVPTPVQVTDGGKLVTDPDQWDPNKGFSIVYVYIEN